MQLHEYSIGHNENTFHAGNFQICKGVQTVNLTIYNEELFELSAVDIRQLIDFLTFTIAQLVTREIAMNTEAENGQ